MEQLPENRELLRLSRQYSEHVISRQEFCRQRREILDSVDAKYNSSRSILNSLVLRPATQVKLKIKQALLLIAYKR